MALFNNFGGSKLWNRWRLEYTAVWIEKISRETSSIYQASLLIQKTFNSTIWIICCEWSQKEFSNLPSTALYSWCSSCIRDLYLDYLHNSFYLDSHFLLFSDSIYFILLSCRWDASWSGLEWYAPSLCLLFSHELWQVSWWISCNCFLRISNEIFGVGFRCMTWWRWRLETDLMWFNWRHVWSFLIESSFDFTNFWK